MEMQSRKIDETTSKRITALRFLLMIFVVFIHNNFTVNELAKRAAIKAQSADGLNFLYQMELGAEQYRCFSFLQPTCG